jgi:transcriptional regulator with XRE-family HTH domain
MRLTQKQHLQSFCSKRKLSGMRKPKTLREARLAKKETLASVAEAVETDVGNLSRIERGEQIPQRELARRLFEHFEGIVPLGIIYDPEHRERA